jgi:hypothetical protein
MRLSAVLEIRSAVAQGDAMSLTGSLFLDSIVLLTVGAFVGLVVLWPRLTPSTPWHVAGRAGALVVVNLLVLLTAATQLNAAYLFYASWADLRGSLGGHMAQTSLHRGGGERAAADLTVGGATAPVAPHPVGLPVPRGSGGLVSYVVHGPLSGLTGRVLVQLPAGYTSSAHASQRYPVLEAFHGYPSEPANWVKYFHFPALVSGVVRAHGLRDPLVVMPDVEIPPGVDTEGVNGGTGQPQLETWLTRDVPDWVGQHFRVIANRDAWATIGYSAGGFDSAMATVLHPAQYGAGIVLGGYFRPEFGPFYQPFPDASPQGRYYDLIRSVAQQPPPVSLWIETSHADHASYDSSAAFLRAVRAPTAVHAVVLRDAGHRDSVWVGLMPEALRWLGHNVRGFRP